MLLSYSLASSAKQYMSEKEFIQQVFPESSQPVKKVLWLNQSLQQKIATILDHQYPKLRLKYWKYGEQTVWFLEKIGKEKPITFGISIKDNQIHEIKVLAFRESRGGEIRMQAYTDQYKQLSIDNENQLDKQVDGITGATMSVNAMKKISRMALMLAKITNQ